MTSFQWMRLSQETRAKLKTLFGINKSQGATTQMFGTRMEVVSDGHTDKDLEAITVEKMQAYLREKKETDFWKLMDATIDKIEHPDKN
jgi:hypothetical protein